MRERPRAPEQFNSSYYQRNDGEYFVLDGLWLRAQRSIAIGPCARVAPYEHRDADHVEQHRPKIFQILQLREIALFQICKQRQEDDAESRDVVIAQGIGIRSGLFPGMLVIHSRHSGMVIHVHRPVIIVLHQLLLRRLRGSRRLRWRLLLRGCQIVMMLEKQDEAQRQGCKHQRCPLLAGFVLLAPKTRSKILSTFRSCRFRLKARLSWAGETRFDILLSFVTSSRKFSPCFQARIACSCTRRYASSRSMPLSARSSRSWPLNTNPPVLSRFCSMRLG